MDQAAQIVIGGLIQGSVFALVALGFALVHRVTGVINLAQGGFCILGALGYQTLLAWGVLPWPLAAALAVLATALFGLAVGAVAFVPALSRLSNSSLLMLTAGLLIVIDGIALLAWGSQPYAVPPFSGEQPIALLGLDIPSQGLWLAGLCAAVSAATWWVLARTAPGRALLACADNATAAALVGIRLRRMRLASFAATAGIGAIGGIAVAPLMSLQFNDGHFFTNAGFIAVALGGMGSLVGAIAGGLFLGVAEQLAAGYVSGLFANALALGLLLLTLLWRPQGLFAGAARRRLDVREEVRADRRMLRFSGWSAAVVALAALLALAALPAVIDAGTLPSLVIALILFIAVLGLDVVMGYAGQVNLGQAGFMALGGYTAAILATAWGIPPLLGTLAGMAVAAIAAVLLSAVTLRLRGAYLALATLAFGLMVDSLVVGLPDLTGGPSGLVGIPSFAAFGVTFATPAAMYYLVLGLAAALVLLLAGGMRAGFGRALGAIRTDPLAAAALGINVARYKLAAIVICAVLGALAGSLYAFDFHYLGPEMVATPRSFELIAMLVLGGEGTLAGGLLGALLLTLLPLEVQALADDKVLVEGLVLVAVFLLAPAGLLGSLWPQRRIAILPEAAR